MFLDGSVCSYRFAVVLDYMVRGGARIHLLFCNSDWLWCGVVVGKEERCWSKIRGWVG